MNKCTQSRKLRKKGWVGAATPHPSFFFENSQYTEQLFRSFLMEKILNPIIVTGCRRSGTTLLRTMLEQHPGLRVHPQEPQFFLQLARRFGTHIHAPKAAIDMILAHPYCPASVTSDALQAAISGYPSISLAELIRLYLSVWGGEDLQSRHAVLKDPAWIFHLDLVFDWFPESKIVHLVRDPRANVSSQRARWKKASVFECAVWWRDAVRAGHALASQTPDVCYEITYEALVTHPEETLTELCNFLNIPFAPQMLSFELDTPTYTPSQAPQRTRFTKPDPARLNLWQEHLSPLDVRLIETVGHHEMGWWGYTPVKPVVSTPALAGRYLLESSFLALLKIGRAIRRIV